jgi:RimJ/RimL family protein N-acetyltransferase
MIPLYYPRLLCYELTYVSEYIFVMPVFPDHKFSNLYNDRETMRYVGTGRTFSEFEVEKMIDNQARTNGLYRYSWTIITHLGIVGRFFLVKPTIEESRFEIIYRLIPKFTKRGFATMTCKLILEHWNGSFVATVHPQNIASICVLLKLGFQLDPDRIGVIKYDSIRDYYLLN